jgi:hypothetical protein
LRTPIKITGSLSHPAIGIDAGSAVVQGGLAVGLATLLSPLAALLPFVDAGLSEDSDCAGLLRDAEAKGTPKAVAPTTTAPRQ